MQAGLFGLQDESELYGLFLNMTKCAIMAYEQHKDNSISQNILRFKSGQKVKRTSKEIYFGGQIRTLYHTGYEIGGLH